MVISEPCRDIQRGLVMDQGEKEELNRTLEHVERKINGLTTLCGVGIGATIAVLLLSLATRG
jgi:hypothetical protein